MPSSTRLTGWGVDYLLAYEDRRGEFVKLLRTLTNEEFAAMRVAE